MKIQNPICPYCNKESVWTENSAIYGKRFGKSYMCYLCKACEAYVGTHKNTRESMGTLANKDLRNLRRQAHELFDPLWKEGGLKRSEAYGLLFNCFGREIHIGESDEKQCKELILFLTNLKDAR